MDWKKKYEDAIIGINAVYENADAATKAALETEFPEPKESEDERIRKEMVDYFSQYKNDGLRGVDITPWIAYLERQKEQSITANDLDEEVHRFFDDCIDVHEAKLYGNISERVIPVDCYEITARHFAKWGEQQKEQKFIDYPYVPGWRKNRDGNKPKLKHSVLMLTTHGVAEGEWLGEKWCQYRWSCELKDNEILYWIHLSDLTQLEKEDEIIEKEQQPAEQLGGTFTSYDMAKTFTEGQNYVVAHPEKFGLYKPAEWSEDFEENIRTLLHNKLTWHSEDGSMSSAVFIDDKTLKDIVSGIWFYVGKEALKYPNKEIHVQEWSEEDEKIRKTLLDYYEKALDNYTCVEWLNGITYGELCDWLKSLRPQPHWKPSDK